MVLIFVSALGHNVAAYVTLVVLVFICAFAYAIAAYVAFVIARIFVHAYTCHELAAPAALVIAFDVDTM